MIEAIRPGGRRPRASALVSLGIGFDGMVPLINPPQVSATSEIDLFSLLVLAASAFLWALGSLYNRQAQLPKSSLMGTGMIMLSGGVGLLLVSILAGEPARWRVAGISTRSMLSWMYLTIFGAGIAFVAYSWLSRVAPTSLVSTYAYVNPLIALLLGHFGAAEPLTPRVSIAAVAIVSSVALTILVQLALWLKRH